MNDFDKKCVLAFYNSFLKIEFNCDTVKEKAAFLLRLFNFDALLK